MKIDISSPRNEMGRSKVSQSTINDVVNLENIENFLIQGIQKIIEYQKMNSDIYGKQILDGLINKKKLIYKLNKQEELYISSQKNDLIKIFRYIVFRYKFYLCGKEKINLGYPPHLLIEPVSTCNLKCPFCFQTDKSFTKKPFMGIMKLELFKKVVDEADLLGIGAVTIASRGEPTLHKELDEMLIYLNNKKNIFEVKLNSNGSFLTENICHSIFKNNVTQVVISSDHYIKKDYERLRLGANFEHIVDNVDRLFKIREEYYPNSGTEIRISGVDNDKNLDRNAFYNFWIKRSDHVTASFPIERWNTYENSVHPKINDPCESLWDRMYVWFDGKVNPCDADYKSYLSYGNFNNDSIKNIWSGKKIKELREEHLNKKRNKINPCNRCGVTFVE